MRLINSSNDATNLQHCSTSVLIVPRIFISIYLLTLGYRSVFGSRTKASALLPVFRETPANYTYNEGSLAVLMCAIQNLGAKTVVWRKATSPQPLTVGQMTYIPDERFEIHHVPEKEEWNLFIKSIKHEDSGIYECQVSTKEKYIRKLIQVVVKDQPYAESVIVLNGPRTVKKGDSLDMTCSATINRSSPHDMDWIKDSQILVSDISGRINITKHISYVTMTIISNLTIKHVEARDKGTYVCMTSDKLVKNLTVEVTGESSENVKRTVTQHTLATSSGATSSRATFYILAMLALHCSQNLVLLMLYIVLSLFYCLIVLVDILLGMFRCLLNVIKIVRQSEYLTQLK